MINFSLCCENLLVHLAHLDLYFLLDSHGEVHTYSRLSHIYMVYCVELSKPFQNL